MTSTIDASNLPSTSGALDEHGRVAGDLVCRRCSYNLRGLSGSGACPECSSPVARSIHGDLLRYCDPKWLRTLARGAYLVVMGMFPMAIGIVVLGVWRTPRIWVVALMVAAGAVVAVGLWMMTARDPGVPDQARQAASRRAIRVCMIGMILLPAGLTLASNLPAAARWGYILITVAIGVTCIVAFFRHLRELARRLADVALERETRIVMWGLAISYAVVIAAILAVLAPGSLPSPFDLLIGLSCTFIIATQVFTLWSITLVGRFHTQLRMAAEAAEVLWTSRETQGSSGAGEDLT